MLQRRTREIRLQQQINGFKEIRVSKHPLIKQGFHISGPFSHA